MTIPVAVLVVAAAAGATWLLTRGGPSRPAVFRAEPTSALYGLIDSRQGDAAPLTLAEVFAPATQRLGDLVRGEGEELSDCDDALTGAEAPGCTQALRAAYQGPSAAGQFVIFNLPDGRSADALVAALGKEGFLRQAAGFDAAHSWAQARALGHYVTVSWVGPVRAGAKVDLTQPQLALDGLTRVVQSRVVNAG
ncbi:hypothetical protein OIE66_25880 [Nonomuraea sp. NBC_01738]|uniref:hypothetical protein n=1 Tax=Nonomuraea sp. NBC_01738 TaxID=2976003 RepID=UPI002E10B328|nr:hypothetical protein OIE66_25880 [Nonomuraea sp. NBC_01738]